MYCKDCKFWEKHTDCWNKSWTECEYTYWAERSDVVEESSAALYADAHDDSGLECGLKTGPMFGCVQFQNKRNK